MNFSIILCLQFLVAFIFMSCGNELNTAGKGAITETTNIQAQGYVEIENATSSEGTTVRIARADSVTAAWEGVIFAKDTVNEKGLWHVSGLFPAQYVAIAQKILTKDSILMGMAYFTLFPDIEEQDSPKITLQAPHKITGTLAKYDSIQADLPSGWYLRAVLRGFGLVYDLDSAGNYEFLNIPAGEHRIRIEKHNGTPGNETTVWVGTIASWR